MRYIEKTIEPAFLTSYKEVQCAANLSVSYNNGFREKSELNDVLRSEQHHICCYCQQKLTHFQGNKIGGAHNEHLIPQSTDPGDGSVELDYNNIYACCIDSEGQSKLQRHCGEAKRDSLIRGFITETNCSLFFKYNILGEILPNGSYDNWKDYVSNKLTLLGSVKDAYDTINILNLNCHQLVEDRKGDVYALLSIINQMQKN